VSALGALQLGARAAGLLLTRLYLHDSRQALRRGLQCFAALSQRLRDVAVARRAASAAAAPANGGRSLGGRDGRAGVLRGSRLGSRRRSRRGSEGPAAINLVRMSDSGARDDVAALEASMAGFASEESSDTNDDEEDEEEEEEEDDDDDEAAREGGEAMRGGEENAEAGPVGSEAEWAEALKVKEKLIFALFSRLMNLMRRQLINGNIRVRVFFFSFFFSKMRMPSPPLSHMQVPSDVLASVGCCHAGLGNLPAAKQCFAPLLQQDPASPAIAAALAR
jgi:hypothetical protein